MKIILALLVLLIFTNAVEAKDDGVNDAFFGLTVGGSLATSNLAFKHYTYNVKGEKIQDHNHGNSGFAMAINGDYRFSLNDRWILGPELHLQHNFATVKRVTVPDAPLELNTASWNYGIAAELGFATAKNNLLYLVVGPEIVAAGSQYTFLNPKVSGAASDNLVGIMGGIGAEQVLSKHFHISEQINYGWFGSINTPLSNGSLRKDELRLSTGMITLSYHN